MRSINHHRDRLLVWLRRNLPLSNCLPRSRLLILSISSRRALMARIHLPPPPKPRTRALLWLLQRNRIKLRMEATVHSPTANRCSLSSNFPSNIHNNYSSNSSSLHVSPYRRRKCSSTLLRSFNHLSLKYSSLQRLVLRDLRMQPLPLRSRRSTRLDKHMPRLSLRRGRHRGNRFRMARHLPPMSLLRLLRRLLLPQSRTILQQSRKPMAQRLSH